MAGHRQQEHRQTDLARLGRRQPGRWSGLAVWHTHWELGDTAVRTGWEESDTAYDDHLKFKFCGPIGGLGFSRESDENDLSTRDSASKKASSLNPHSESSTRPKLPAYVIRTDDAIESRLPDRGWRVSSGPLSQSVDISQQDSQLSVTAHGVLSHHCM